MLRFSFGYSDMAQEPGISLFTRGWFGFPVGVIPV